MGRNNSAKRFTDKVYLDSREKIYENYFCYFIFSKMKLFSSLIFVNAAQAQVVEDDMCVRDGRVAPCEEIDSMPVENETQLGRMEQERRYVDLKMMAEKYWSK